MKIINFYYKYYNEISEMFKGYISHPDNTIRWFIRSNRTFIMPYLKKIVYPLNDTSITVHRKDRFKILGEFEVNHNNETHHYLIKIYRYPRLSQKLKQILKRTKAFHEFNMTYIADKKNLPVEVPVAFGERKSLFFIGESYLIIKKLKNSHTLKDYFASNISRKVRRTMLREFGKLSRNVHDSGIRQDDFSLNNFLVHDDARIILLDFERVSFQTKGLSEKRRVWYLAKLNRIKGMFTNTDRLRFLLSYTNGNLNQCKRLARLIESLTVIIQKRDAKKFMRQCIRTNRKFGVFKYRGFYGRYKKTYSLETLQMLLESAKTTDKKIHTVNCFQIFRFSKKEETNKTKENIHRMWRHANALHALRINVPDPVGIFMRNETNRERDKYLIVRLPDNCVSLEHYINNISTEELFFALKRFIDHVSPFGVINNNVTLGDLSVQITPNNRFTCYLGNVNLFNINRHSVLHNKKTNTQRIRWLFQKPLGVM